MEIVPFADEHVEGAAELLAERHAAHRAVEPLLPERSDFATQIEREGENGSAAQRWVELQSPEEMLAEWLADDGQDFELFAAERRGRVVGQFLLYRRPADLRVPDGSIDLAPASTEPAARATGVGARSPLT